VQDQQRGAVLPSLLIVIGVAGLVISAIRLEQLSRP
jgi:Tfp pilus assembly major pilin PilA